MVEEGQEPAQGRLYESVELTRALTEGMAAVVRAAMGYDRPPRAVEPADLDDLMRRIRPDLMGVDESASSEVPDHEKDPWLDTPAEDGKIFQEMVERITGDEDVGA
jgi:hypothetical protein